jgi:parallel beta-helix repeat protein
VDIAPSILTDDDVYFLMEQGDYAYLTFDEPAANPGYERSFVVEAKGYYESPHIAPLEGEIPEELAGQFLADFNYAMRYHLERYRPSRHCGIYMDDLSDFNKIYGNRIHENYGDGIYLVYADNNRIIDNIIYDNEYTGIYIYYSNSNEIYCNDIYENGWDDTGIYLNSNSWSNIMSYNNIFDNDGDGVQNDNIGEQVDAANNWWGCTDGPGNAGCDSVSANVTYAPWKTEPCIACPFLPLAVGGDFYPVDPSELGAASEAHASDTTSRSLIAVWVGLASVFAICGGFLAIRRRRAH